MREGRGVAAAVAVVAAAARVYKYPRPESRGCTCLHMAGTSHRIIEIAENLRSLLVASLAHSVWRHGYRREGVTRRIRKKEFNCSTCARLQSSELERLKSNY